MNFYVVHKGKNPGIYKTWIECKKEVEGYTGAMYKKFDNIKDAEIFIENNKIDEEKLYIKTNYDYEIIQNLFSNMSSLSVFELLEMRSNYKELNYSLTEVDLQLIKLISYPIFFVLMVVFSGIIMMNTKSFKSKNLKITIGFFFSVIIYYINNFFYVLGNTEKISILTAITLPLFVFALINLILLKDLNVK